MIFDSSNYKLVPAPSWALGISDVIAGDDDGVDVGGVWLFQALNYTHRLLTKTSSFDAKYPKSLPDPIECFGVVPDVETLHQLVVQPLRDISDRTFIVGAYHVDKNDWFRWHKWGGFLTHVNDERRPTVEHLHNEPGFDEGVFIYSVHEPDA